IIDTGDDDVNIAIDQGGGAANVLKIDSGTTVTFGPGNFGAGFDNDGGLLIDGDSTLILGSGVSMADRGANDIVGSTGLGTLTVQSGASFDTLNLIIGNDAGSDGEVTVDSPALGFEVVQSAPR